MKNSDLYSITTFLSPHIFITWACLTIYIVHRLANCACICLYRATVLLGLFLRVFQCIVQVFFTILAHFRTSFCFSWKVFGSLACIVVFLFRHANISKQILQGLYCSLRQLLEEGFFHADPHPGNLVATEGGSLAYFDFGMMGDIPRHYRVGLIQMVIIAPFSHV